MAAGRPQRERRAARVPRAARGECEGRPRGRWFPGLFRGIAARLPGKNSGKHRGPCRASGFRGRLPSRGPNVLDAEGGAFPARGPGRGSPRARPWARVRDGASPGSSGAGRRVSTSEGDRVQARGGSMRKGPSRCGDVAETGAQGGVPLGALVEYGGLEGAVWS